MAGVNVNDGKEKARKKDKKRRQKILSSLGQCLRGMAVLGRGRDAEDTFARVAIMPLIRSKLSLGKIDEGGPRGRCVGLPSLLDALCIDIAATYGDALALSECTLMCTFDDNTPTQHSDLDLVTGGVWVPIFTALTVNTPIKMAIFSPGIASILQANYVALNNFLTNLSSSLLQPSHSAKDTIVDDADTDTLDKYDQDDGSDELDDCSDFFYAHLFQPEITPANVLAAQRRINAHPTTADFLKKWNLPIYYQLRFGESCSRLNVAISRVRHDGWTAACFTGTQESEEAMRESGFELPVFMELYEIMQRMWDADVFLRPLSHRFMRGTLQLFGRMVAFVSEGLQGKVEFGAPRETSEKEKGTNGQHHTTRGNGAVSVYRWSERPEDAAAVAWDLMVLTSCLTDSFLEKVTDTVVSPDGFVENTADETDEIRSIVREAISETCDDDAATLIAKCWSDIIVRILTEECTTPLAAVKGVAATYRMTNRPPPTQPSPFVVTILRPLLEFDRMFGGRCPPQLGEGWKIAVVQTVSDRYSASVEELMATVRQMEEALKKRKVRNRPVGGQSSMADGEKVRLQLLLDYKEFSAVVESAGVDRDQVEGLKRLKELVKDAEGLLVQIQQGTNSAGGARS
eukprot:CAMPEP_0113320756 /NCGR_PEP_ID=MMETSP0010_2-20120614/14468_1 /TAXON_ID=216773 ORGANISM="Corethron hystrix, Strain 308" /NCGR_SAMPLE_ID=MMETSP0010_2 /ASSEMBLY_ACC=CAM_ASM_000155 /LENGTH=628 /DNA_ID=CAMNT_0000178663 /DNA_START=157 /DNA_END=2043 /DNA_ORIENTATION=+ /assembly_acc=CAM_ASM_000155